ncbi:hypothetical protein BOX15_Mlig031372g3 [Macrostomum lignano]|uniref:Protein kinase domain-containing protein n=1 Tax=Macrostomum lignano TaxID=282301 RepID=A0A267DEX9_9PLAT|nr:hypothetical protein BOX15_Mlig031372g3 [Macrostomum lignano]
MSQESSNQDAATQLPAALSKDNSTDAKSASPTQADSIASSANSIKAKVGGPNQPLGYQQQLQQSPPTEQQSEMEMLHQKLNSFSQKEVDRMTEATISKKTTAAVAKTPADSADELKSKPDRAPFDMVKSDDTYSEWLLMEAELFPLRYFSDRHVKTMHKYSIVRVLGQGGFGLVLLVSVEKGGPLYAMKVMSKEKIREKKMIKYIIGERRALSAVHNPFIMSLIDKLKDNSNVYMILPFIECGDLYRLMLSTRLKRFSHEDAKFYMSQVFLAFEYLHRMRVLYRDLKPENLMLDRFGYLQLADLGFAKLLDPSRERTYSTLGTPDYMAPEIFSAKNCGYSFSVDWWTTGCLLFEFLVGFPPFHTPNGNTMHVIKKILSTEIQFPNFVKPDAKDMVNCLCQKNPHNRMGCQKAGPSAIREHAFFQDVDFVRVFHKQLPAPHKPTSKDDKRFYTGRPVPKNVIRISKTMRYNTMFAEF